MPDTVEEQHITVRAVIFSSSEQGFCIFRAWAEKQKDEFVAKGYVGDLKEDDEIIIWGEWVKHPKYGLQVNISSFRLPDITQGTLAFLKSGFIKGIGPSLAGAVWKRFGDDTARVMDEEPERLLEVSGIGEKKLEDIKISWRENRSKQETLVKFQEWGIGPMTIQKIFRQWPDGPLETVRDNPYLLAWEIEGVGFLTADKIAFNMGIAEDSPHRLRAGIYYVLQEAFSKEGHCYLDRRDLVDRTRKMIRSGTFAGDDPEREIEREIKALVTEGYLVDSEGRIYTRIVYQAERSLASNLTRLQGGVPVSSQNSIKELVAYQHRQGIVFDGKQRAAIQSALDNKICIITGGPGTGKTTIVRAVLELAEEAGIKETALVAPTGRAAKRLQESTGHTGKTIHRYLGFHPGQGFYYNADNRVSDDLVICDEASMLDVFLAKNLTAALPDTARLVLVGDIHQLPSVGAGNVLRDCIKSRAMPVTELDTIHRQEEGSWIVRNAHAVKNGRVRDMNLTNKTSDFFWEDMAVKFPNLSPAERSLELQKRILGAMKSMQEKGHPADSIQVLTPIYKGPVGVSALNNELQALLNPAGSDKTEARIGFKLFREGDRVMQLKNDYDKEVFNGDQGRIKKIDNREGRMAIEFEGAPVEYEFLDADQLALAYACTIHKSQGSEFPITIIPVTVSHYIMLQRNLLYTAVTRARKTCFLLGEKKALGIAVNNDKPIIRNTDLKRLLAGEVTGMDKNHNSYKEPCHA